MVERYERLRKLEIFDYMSETNKHLERMRGGDYDEHWVEAYNIHKKKFLHPQMEPFIITDIEACIKEEEKKNVSAGYRSKYFTR